MNTPVLLDAKWREGCEPTPFEAALASADRASEILDRTSRIVKRLAPMPLLGWQSSRYPELNAKPTAERWEARANARREQERLFREIKPRIEAKVNRRDGPLSDEQLQMISAGHRRFERLERRHERRAK